MYEYINNLTLKLIKKDVQKEETKIFGKINCGIVKYKM